MPLIATNRFSDGQDGEKASILHVRSAWYLVRALYSRGFVRIGRGYIPSKATSTIATEPIAFWSLPNV